MEQLSMNSFRPLDAHTHSQIVRDVSEDAAREKQEREKLEALESNLALKMQFAEGLLRDPKHPYAVAHDIFHNDLASATYAYLHWPRDEKVIEFQQRLLDEHGAAHFLPTKEEVAREIYDRASNCRDIDLFAKTIRLYCDVMGHIEKPGMNVTNNLQLVNNVMEVPRIENEDDWQQLASEQQTTLKEIRVESSTKSDDSQSE